MCKGKAKFQEYKKIRNFIVLNSFFQRVNIKPFCMKLSNLVTIISIFSAVTCLNVSCSKDDNDTSRNVRYEVSGNTVGPVTVQYTPDPVAIDVSLPWIHEVTLDNTVQEVQINVSGAHGLAGDSVIIKIYSNNIQVKRAGFLITSGGGSASHHF